MDIATKITKAKVKLQKESPFFSYLVLNLKIKQSDETKTMGVDNMGNLYYSEKWVKSLSLDELKGVLIHEVLHLALSHFIRGKDKDRMVYNIASDLVINCILKNNNFRLPEGALIPSYNTYILDGNITKNGKAYEIKNIDKKSAEEIYNELMNKLKTKSVKILSKKQFDEHIYGNGKGNKGENKSEKEIEGEQIKKWKQILTESSVYAKQQGNLPKGMERSIDILLNDKINWKTLLYKYITNELPFDYTYNYPSKKSRATGIFMPSVKRESIDIVISVDTSGSIGQEELSEFLGEIVGIAKSFNNINMTLIVCDCEIKDIYEVRNGNIDTILNLKIRGGGGTNHKLIYDYVAENMPNTRFIINFTDGYTSFNNIENNPRTIWVITKGGIDESKIPFGEVISLK